MIVPIISSIIGAAGAAGAGYLSSRGGSTTWGAGGMGPPSITYYRKRRRKARLTQGDIMELNNIKNILGRTAAANALPFYLGRGRG